MSRTSGRKCHRWTRDDYGRSWPFDAGRSGPFDIERGSGTLLSLSVVIFMLSLTAVFSVFGRYIVVGHRAAAAADLAALAGAQAYGTGKDGCGAARSLAARNDQQLARCSVVGDRVDFVLSVQITASVPTRVPVLPKKIVATAHAGPVR